MTCGGADFILIYGPLEGSIARQQCEWYAGLYDEQEVKKALRIMPPPHLISVNHLPPAPFEIWTSDT